MAKKTWQENAIENTKPKKNVPAGTPHFLYIQRLTEKEYNDEYALGKFNDKNHQPTCQVIGTCAGSERDSNTDYYVGYYR